METYSITQILNEYLLNSNLKLVDNDETEVFDYVEFPFWKPVLEKAAWRKLV